MNLFKLTFLVFLLLSCGLQKGMDKIDNINLEFDQTKSIENAYYGITSYLLFPINNGNIGFSTNYSLCRTLLPDSINAGEIVCFKYLTDFYYQNRSIKYEEAVQNNSIEILNPELLKFYHNLEVDFFLDNMFDKNCKPKNNKQVSNVNEKAAALILKGVQLVRDGFGGTDFHLSGLSMEEFCKK